MRAKEMERESESVRAMAREKGREMKRESERASAMGRERGREREKERERLGRLRWRERARAM